MYPSSSPLVPDEQFQERDFAPGISVLSEISTIGTGGGRRGKTR